MLTKERSSWSCLVPAFTACSYLSGHKKLRDQLLWEIDVPAPLSLNMELREWQNFWSWESYAEEEHNIYSLIKSTDEDVFPNKSNCYELEEPYQAQASRWKGAFPLCTGRPHKTYDD